MLLRLSYEEIIDMELIVETQLGHFSYVEVEEESSCEARFIEKGGELYWNRTGKIFEVQLLVHRDKFDRLYGHLERLVPAKAGQGGGKGKEPPAYRWEFDKENREVSCNDSQSVTLEPNLFNLFLYLYNTKPNVLVTVSAVEKKFTITKGQARNRIN